MAITDDVRRAARGAVPKRYNHIGVVHDEIVALERSRPAVFIIFRQELRIGKVVFGAYDEKAGSMGTLINLCDLEYNHRPQIIGGYMENECCKILTEFFSLLRNK